MIVRPLNVVFKTYWLITLVLFGCGLWFKVYFSVLVTFIFTPWALDFTRLCCTNGGEVVAGVFIGLQCLMIGGYLGAALAASRGWRLAAGSLGVVAVILWYLLVLLFFLISGLEH